MKSTDQATGPMMDIGITATDRAEIAAGLSRLLADSFTLYMLTHNFHWNVKGPMFNSLHQMFMVQYTEQWNALDVIAERIRALGHPAPGTYSEFAKLASIEAPEGVPAAMDMVRHAGGRAGSHCPHRTQAASAGGWPVTSRPPIC
jgi:starvation-inducible DNA-binding protein